ncbi:serine hydrolase [Brachybacterium aquaticum]|uniref:CubicO group peptidase (Beta-lactamase class C family) n=1 Tax=Brachybacterium aquaticum TaxID=1432564 RepID=A0A841AJB9_9MICO|nr:serine hydrolase [Brachybacterium aquaticum]MBB5833134.1 CubicO group peptidase (beta-lactamase class C family) [Brachybacterium aquaticum]
MDQQRPHPSSHDQACRPEETRRPEEPRRPEKPRRPEDARPPEDGRDHPGESRRPGITRRASLAATALTAAAGAVGLPAAAHAMGDPAPHKDRPTARAQGSAPEWSRGRPHRHPWDRQRSGRTLKDMTPRAVGLDAGVLGEIPAIVGAGLDFDPPRFSGATVLVASQGGIAYRHADGYALRWAGRAIELPEAERIPARTDTLYDLASISKIFTATAVMQLVEQGRLGLEDTVASHLPRFAENGKGEVTVQQLLTHVGGLPAFINLYSAYPDIPSRLDAVLTVAPTSAPGTRYVYSDLGLITLGLIVEKLSGQSLDAYVREHITAPLGVDDTMYNPPAELLPRIAATEYVEYYGRLVHGHVHDENAYSLGGVAGHAGVFSTADDLAVFAQMFLGGGRYGGAEILRAETVQSMFTDRIAEVTGVGGARRGLGPELEAWYYHAGLTSPYSGVHTGFTGMSLVIDPLTETVVILLTNSVHPTREWSTTSVTRREVSTCVARALGLVPREVRDGWHAGDADAATSVLSLAVGLGEGPSGGSGDGGAAVGGAADAGAATLEAELFVHLETGYDLLRLEASADDGATWTPLAGRLTAKDQDPVEVEDGTLTGWGRRVVWNGTFPLVQGGQALTGEVQLRLVLTTDGSTRGLGAWVGRLRGLAADGRTVLMDTDRRADREQVVAEGWTLGG